MITIWHANSMASSSTSNSTPEEGKPSFDHITKCPGSRQRDRRFQGTSATGHQQVMVLLATPAYTPLRDHGDNAAQDAKDLPNPSQRLAKRASNTRPTGQVRDPARVAELKRWPPAQASTRLDNSIKQFDALHAPKR
jgi:hypothetical protein